jgi:hypothetical protein
MTASPLVKALDAAAPQQVTYCIPAWLRDEQIKLALARPHIGRLQPVETPRAEPCAVVGFGPSLRETWEEVRAFGPNVLSCSGSHKFLIEHGIVPRWHVEVDPREHKVALLGQPHPDVEYLLASTCHPKVFDHLAGSKVTLWHVFDGSEEGQRLLPYGEWAVTGGCDVGLRAMTMAAFLGFRDIHLFGLDGCAPDADAQRHAAEHPNGRQKYATCEYGEKTYYTTPAMLEAARQTFHELNQMPHVRATFHGTGLIQAMAQDYVPATAPIPAYLQNVVGFAKPELISAEYRALNAQLHRENLAYGVGGGKHAATVKKLRVVRRRRVRARLRRRQGLPGEGARFPNLAVRPGDPGDRGDRRGRRTWSSARTCSSTSNRSGCVRARRPAALREEGRLLRHPHRPGVEDPAGRPEHASDSARRDVLAEEAREVLRSVTSRKGASSCTSSSAEGQDERRRGMTDRCAYLHRLRLA